MSKGKTDLTINLNLLRRRISRQIQNSTLESNLGFKVLDKVTSAILLCERESKLNV